MILNSNVAPLVPARSSNGNLGEEYLKKQYLECLSGFSARATDTLRQVVDALVGLGIGVERNGPSLPGTTISVFVAF